MYSAPSSVLSTYWVNSDKLLSFLGLSFSFVIGGERYLPQGIVVILFAIVHLFIHCYGLNAMALH